MGKEGFSRAVHGGGVTQPERCACPECRDLDRLPERLQGIPDSWQMKLPIAKPRRGRHTPKGPNDAA
jgi:hypothetical protein